MRGARNGTKPRARDYRAQIMVISVLTVLILQLGVAGTPPSTSRSASVPATRSGLSTTVASPLAGNSSPTSIAVGSYPSGAVYDARNGYVYVCNAASSTVSVIDGSTVVGTIPVGSWPTSGAYDSWNGYVYIANFDGISDNVSIINGTTLVGSVSVGYNPQYPVFDDRNGFVYVPEANGGGVDVINGTSLVGTVLLKPGPGNVRAGPYDVAYDSANGYVYATSLDTDNVSVINGTTLVASVNIGGWSEMVTYDSRHGYVFVSRSDSNTEVILNGTSVVGTVLLGLNGTSVRPGYSVFDPVNGYVYVSSWNADGVTVFDGTSVIASLSLGDVAMNPPGALSVDPVSGRVYVTNSQPDQVGVIVNQSLAASIPAGSGPVFAQYDASDGLEYVLNVESANVTILPRWYPVSVHAQGLPPGTQWWLNTTGEPTVSRSFGSSGTQVAFEAPNATYTFTIGAADKSYRAAGGSFQVNGSAVVVNVSFTLVTYPITFAESGLTAGTAWNITLGGVSQRSNLSTITFSAPNGTLGYSVGSVPGWTTSNYSGVIDVAGAGSVVPVVWTQFTFLVTFSETGLPNGTGWAVITGSQYQGSQSSTLTLREPNGTYWFEVPSIGGYVPNSSGSFQVSGRGLNVSVVFRPQTYLVIFTVVGLPSGTNWSVNARNNSLGINESGNSTTHSIILSLPNGTYVVTFSFPPGYSLNNSTTTITVAGKATAGPTFTLTPPAREVPSAQLDWTRVAEVVGSVLAVSLATTAAVVRWRLRERDRGVELVGALLALRPGELQTEGSEAAQGARQRRKM